MGGTQQQEIFVVARALASAHRTPAERLSFIPPDTHTPGAHPARTSESTRCEMQPEHGGPTHILCHPFIHYESLMSLRAISLTHNSLKPKTPPTPTHPTNPLMWWLVSWQGCPEPFSTLTREPPYIHGGLTRRTTTGERAIIMPCICRCWGARLVCGCITHYFSRSVGVGSLVCSVTGGLGRRAVAIVGSLSLSVDPLDTSEKVPNRSACVRLLHVQCHVYA